MKIEEAYKQIVEQQIEEGLYTKTIAAATIAGAALMPSHMGVSTIPTDSQKSMVVKKFDPKHSVDLLVKHYKLNPDKAQHIVDTAIKYSKTPFPQAQHILGTIGVESSFNEKAKSNLRYDPARGLMQIRPKITGVHPTELKTIEGQIKHGADLLHQLYNKTGDIDKSIQSYNIGLTSYNRGNRAENYLEKTKKETARHLIPITPSE